MIPAEFAYDRPATLDDALRLLGQYGSEAKVLAGGQSLLPLLKLRVASAARLIDIGRLRELRYVREGAGGGISIGAMTTYREILDSALVKERFPILAEAVYDIGDLQVRNRGTVGGALAHADPASDLPAVAIALGAQLVLRSGGAERVVPADAFFTGPFTTAVADGELLTEIRVPASLPGSGGAYRNMEQPASGYSIVGVAASVARSGGRVSHLRVGITGVGDSAYRATGVESALLGSDGSAAAIADAAAHATEGQVVASDIHADREYRTQMAIVYTRRAIEAAVARAS